MNRDFKLLITDLDGTALPLAGYADDIPQANIAAVKKSNTTRYDSINCYGSTAA